MRYSFIVINLCAILHNEIPQVFSNALSSDEFSDHGCSTIFVVECLSLFTKYKISVQNGMEDAEWNGKLENGRYDFVNLSYFTRSAGVLVTSLLSLVRLIFHLFE